MKLLHLFLIFALLGTVACSNNKKKADESSEEVVSTEIEEDSDFVVDSEEGEDLLVDDTVEVEPEEEVVEVEEEVIEGDLPSEEEVIAEVTEDEEQIVVSGGDEAGVYTVQEGDTLMWIAFKIYGDYSQWQRLEEDNPGLMSSNLKKGDKISYTGSMFVDTYRPKGKPHLVINGETLGTISNDKYGTPRKWRSIYDNNQPLIKDPNLIFAGFTLYYIPGRDVASK